jgi:hypothetical protein
MVSHALKALSRQVTGRAKGLKGRPMPVAGRVLPVVNHVLAVAIGLLAVRASAQQAYEATDLGTVGGKTSTGFGINDNDQVVGSSTIG